MQKLLQYLYKYKERYDEKFKFKTRTVRCEI